MTEVLGTDAVHSEDQLCSRQVWYASVHFNQVLKPIGADHEMVSVICLPNGDGFSALGFGRYLGDRPFGTRERTLVHLIHTELAHVWRRPRANGAVRDALAGLSRRLRETLELLHAGLSEKQISIRLALSVHTVHDYVKELHRRFHVSSTPELVARTRVHREFEPRLLPADMSATS
jgi:DNA-binding CsgD family transcriptional regulator